MRMQYDDVPTDAQERDHRVRALLQVLANYPHGKSGTHFWHSLDTATYKEVLAIMELFGDTPEGDSND